MKKVLKATGKVLMFMYGFIFMIAPVLIWGTIILIHRQGKETSYEIERALDNVFGE